MAYSKAPRTYFELIIDDITDLKVLNSIGIFFCEKNMKLYNAAIAGCFHVEQQQTKTWKVWYDAVKMKSFDILVAILEDNVWQCVLRMFTNENEVFCSQLDPKVSLLYGKLPDQHEADTALVLCITTSKIKIVVKQENGQQKTIEWTPSSLIMSDSLHNEFPLNGIEPSRYHPCPECLVVSNDGCGHVLPCPPKRTISGRREQLITSTMNKVFQLRFEEDCHIKVLNGDTGKFIDVRPGTSFFNEVIEGIFSFKATPNNRSVLTFDAVSIKRFSMVFGFFYKKAWRLRLRLVVTTTNGIVGFPMTKTMFMNDGKFEVPKEFQTNTVLLFGLHTQSDAINLALRVFANTTGYTHETFGGYTCELKWDRRHDTIDVPDCLQSKFAKKKFYSANLYQANGTHRVVGGIAEQRLVNPPVRYDLPTQRSSANNENQNLEHQIEEMVPESADTDVQSMGSPAHNENEDFQTQDRDLNTESDDSDVQFNSFHYWKFDAVEQCVPANNEQSEESEVRYGLSMQRTIANNENQILQQQIEEMIPKSDDTDVQFNSFNYWKIDSNAQYNLAANDLLLEQNNEK